jgi:hypothetical protein
MAGPERPPKRHAGVQGHSQGAAEAQAAGHDPDGRTVSSQNQALCARSCTIK